jgi:hypothetical protein
MWSESWQRGTNNREQPPLSENYFKMIARGVSHGCFTLFLCTEKFGKLPQTYYQLNQNEYEMQNCNFAQAQNQKWDAVFAVSGLLSRLS